MADSSDDASSSAGLYSKVKSTQMSETCMARDHSFFEERLSRSTNCQMAHEHVRWLCCHPTAEGRGNEVYHPAERDVFARLPCIVPMVQLRMGQG